MSANIGHRTTSGQGSIGLLGGSTSNLSHSSTGLGAGSSSGSGGGGGGGGVGDRTTKRSAPRAAETTHSVANASETRSLVFQWPLTGLKQLFDSSRGDVKSKVVKSVPFGKGRWTVLFYAQSGLEQFCSLYLNAEALESEQDPHRPQDIDIPRERSWTRKGLYSFTFSIQTLDKSMTIGTKEAHSHAYSSSTSNWGWAQFAKRDTAYYNNQKVKDADGFLITVSIQAEAEKPRDAKPFGQKVPLQLISAMGSLLDDPELSDVVFVVKPPASHRHLVKRKARTRKIYAIKKILAGRCEYFRNMFEGGFAEGDAEDSDAEHDEEVLLTQSPASHDHAQEATSIVHGVNRVERGLDAINPSSDPIATSARADFSSISRPFGRRPVFSETGSIEEDDFYGHEPLLEDSDTELDLALIRTNLRSHLASAAWAEDSDKEYARSSGDEYILPEPSQATHKASAATTLSPILPEGDPDLASRIPRKGLTDISKSSRLSPNQCVSAVKDSVAHISLEPSSSTGGESATSSSRSTGKRGRAATGHHEVGVEVASGAQDPHHNHDIDRRKRRRVVIRDSSYHTFKALLYYLYTDRVEFAPLTSTFLEQPISKAGARAPAPFPIVGISAPEFGLDLLRAHRKRKEVIDDAAAHDSEERPRLCSAKAMYRLADKLQLVDLKELAKKHILDSLDQPNIVWEAFSSFSSHYPEILRPQIDFMLRHWRSVKRGHAMKNLFARAHAHPGLPQVWPPLLDQLEYRRGGPMERRGGRGGGGGGGGGGEDEEQEEEEGESSSDSDHFLVPESTMSRLIRRM